MEALTSVLHNAHDPGAAGRAFGFARDYVLEAVANELLGQHYSHAVHVVRAMKGTP